MRLMRTWPLSALTAPMRSPGTGRALGLRFLRSLARATISYATVPVKSMTPGFVFLEQLNILCTHVVGHAASKGRLMHKTKLQSEQYGRPEIRPQRLQARTLQSKLTWRPSVMVQQTASTSADRSNHLKRKTETLIGKRADL